MSCTRSAQVFPASLFWVTPLSDGLPRVSEATSFPNTYLASWVTFCRCSQDVSSKNPSAALHLEGNWNAFYILFKPV